MDKLIMIVFASIITALGVFTTEKLLHHSMGEARIFIAYVLCVVGWMIIFRLWHLTLTKNRRKR